MPHANHAWVQTDYGYCAEASCLELRPGVRPGQAFVLDPWNRPVAAEWEERVDREGEVTMWRARVDSPNGVAELLEIFND